MVKFWNWTLARSSVAGLLAASLAGAALVAGLFALPPLVQRWRSFQQLAAREEAIRRQPPAEPGRRRLSEQELREKLMRPEPGRAVFELRQVREHHR
jgi:hypothetical protein